MLNVADRLGSLTPKKEATFIAVDGDIFDIRTNVKHMWIDGKKSQPPKPPHPSLRKIQKPTKAN
jgi:imidazolonepropionase-like amidohydrolase